MGNWFTRDSVIWTVLVASGVLTYLMGHFDLLAVACPGLGPAWEARIELLAGLLAVVSALFHWSPAEISEAGRQKLQARDADTALRKLSAILLVAVLSAGVTGCASAGGALVQADQAVHLAVATTQDTLDRLCDTRVLAPARCQQANADLVPVIQAADDFNRAVRADSAAAVPQMVGALDRLTRGVVDLLPDGQEQAALRRQIDAAIAAVRVLLGR